MKKCVVLSMDDTSGYEIYDQLFYPALEEAGWEIDTLSWRADVDWNNYQLVMLRSPWDYQLAAEAFLGVLEKIEASSAHLDNPLEVVRWNINKKYLRDLSDKGVLIIPTLWRDEIDENEIDSFFTELKTYELVIKPCISAGAFDTYRLTQDKALSLSDELVSKFKNREVMIQPFVESVVSEGEFSIFYFDDQYSHTILKTPKKNDFRVQEEWGGRLQKVEPEEKLTQAAEKVLNAIDSVFNCTLLYTRLDFVRYGDDFALIEAELIEPSLYFNLDPDSPQRFADAVERRYKRLGII